MQSTIVYKRETQLQRFEDEELLTIQQKGCIDECIQKIKDKNGCLLYGDMRTGKTRVSLMTAYEMGFDKVLFLTKKANKDNVHKDLHALKIDFTTCLIDTTEKFIRQDTASRCDMIIIDESHLKISTYPRPSKTWNILNRYIKEAKCKVMLLTGTPAPETDSQIYHQLALIPDNDLKKQYKDFYKFAKENVKMKYRYLGARMIEEYDKCTLCEQAREIIDGYIIRMKGDESKRKNRYSQEVVMIESPKTEACINDIHNWGYYNNEDSHIEEIYCNTKPGRLHMIRMLAGGSYFIQNTKKEVFGMYTRDKFFNTYHCFPCEKQDYIMDAVGDRSKRIAIFYYYKSELAMLQELLGDVCTVEVEEFNDKKKNVIVLQSISKREGIKLREIDEMIFYSIDWSALTYIQARERGISFHDEHARDYKIKFLINSNKNSIDYKVYDTIVNKNENFTSRMVSFN